MTTVVVKGLTMAQTIFFWRCVQWISFSLRPWCLLSGFSDYFRAVSLMWTSVCQSRPISKRVEHYNRPTTYYYKQVLITGDIHSTEFRVGDRGLQLKVLSHILLICYTDTYPLQT